MEKAQELAGNDSLVDEIVRLSFVARSRDYSHALVLAHLSNRSEGQVAIGSKQRKKNNFHAGCALGALKSSDRSSPKKTQ